LFATEGHRTYRAEYFWPEQIDRRTFDDRSGNYLGASYVLDEQDLPHILSAGAELGAARATRHHIPPQSETTPDPDDLNALVAKTLMRSTTPYDGGFFVVHAEMDGAGRFCAPESISGRAISAQTPPRSNCTPSSRKSSRAWSQPTRICGQRWPATRTFL
jgi:hypothetical protein